MEPLLNAVYYGEDRKDGRSNRLCSPLGQMVSTCIADQLAASDGRRKMGQRESARRNTMVRRIAIVGGGVSGLGAAWALHNQPARFDLSLFEAQEQIGECGYSRYAARRLLINSLRHFRHRLYPLCLSPRPVVAGKIRHRIDRYQIQLQRSLRRWCLCHDFDSEIRGHLQFAIQEGIAASYCQRRASGSGAVAVLRIGIELGAVVPKGHDFAVGTTKERARSVLFATPDYHILQNVPSLLRRHYLVHDGRAKSHWEKP